MSANFRIFVFLFFSEHYDLGNPPVGCEVCESLQSIGNGCGLQMDGVSPHFGPCDLIFNGFHDLHRLGIIFDGLTLFPEGPSILRDLSDGPRTLCECPAQLVATCLDLSGLVWTCLDLSQLVGTCLVSCGLKGRTLGPYT